MLRTIVSMFNVPYEGDPVQGGVGAGRGVARREVDPTRPGGSGVEGVGRAWCPRRGRGVLVDDGLLLSRQVAA